MRVFAALTLLAVAAPAALAAPTPARALPVVSDAAGLVNSTLVDVFKLETIVFKDLKLAVDSLVSITDETVTGIVSSATASLTEVEKSLDSVEGLLSSILGTSNA